MVRRAPNRRPSPKNTKNFSGGWGKAFWPGSGSLISVSKNKIPPPVWRVPKIGKKVPFWHIFRTTFRFSKVTKCRKLQHFCVLASFAGAIQKRRNCCKYPYFLDPRCTKHCKYQCFLQAKQQNTGNYNIFGGLIAKNAGIYMVFAISRKRGRNETL